MIITYILTKLRKILGRFTAKAGQINESQRMSFKRAVKMMDHSTIAGLCSDSKCYCRFKYKRDNS